MFECGYEWDVGEYDGYAVCGVYFLAPFLFFDLMYFFFADIVSHLNGMRIRLWYLV